MKTLVIHPFDVTTGFLSVIYEGKKDWTVIDTNVSSKFLKEQIKNHNRIIMLGLEVKTDYMGLIGWLLIHHLFIF